MNRADSVPFRRLLPLLGLLLLSSCVLPLLASAWAPHDTRGHDAARTTRAAFRVIPVGGFDGGRGRDVPARLFWPAAARDGGVPLVVFSHGIGSSDDGYTHLGRFWANHGIASVHVRHVGSDRSLWRGNPLDLVRRFRNAAADNEAIARAGDARWVLDRVLSGPYAARIDRSRIVAAGHSYGANTAMLLAGARVVRDGAVLQFGDARVRAAILLSAPPFYGDDDVAPIIGGIALPTLHVTTHDDVIRIPGFGSGVADRERIFAAIGGDKTLAMFAHGSHNVFTDRRYFDTADVAAAVKASTRALTLAFVQALDSEATTRFAALSALDGADLQVRSIAGAPRFAAAPAARGSLPSRARGQR